jgi:hypothetical protein
MTALLWDASQVALLIASTVALSVGAHWIARATKQQPLTTGQIHRSAKTPATTADSRRGMPRELHRQGTAREPSVLTETPTTNAKEVAQRRAEIHSSETGSRAMPAAQTSTVSHDEHDEDAILESALKGEDDAAMVLDEALNQGSPSNETTGTRCPKPDERSRKAKMADVAAKAQDVELAHPEQDAAQNLVDAALDELEDTDSLLDECLEAAATQSTGSPAAPAAAKQTASPAAASPPAKKPVAMVEVPANSEPQPDTDSDGDGTLVLPKFMTTLSRPQPDSARAAVLARMGKELGALDQCQAALDAFCAAYRVADPQKDVALRNDLVRCIRDVYERCDMSEEYKTEVARWL